MSEKDGARSELGRLVDVVAGLRAAGAKLAPGDERALWAAVRCMAEDRLAQLGRKAERGRQ